VLLSRAYVTKAPGQPLRGPVNRGSCGCRLAEGQILPLNGDNNAYLQLPSRHGLVAALAFLVNQRHQQPSTTVGRRCHICIFKQQSITTTAFLFLSAPHQCPVLILAAKQTLKTKYNVKTHTCSFHPGMGWLQRWPFSSTNDTSSPAPQLARK
jgi:hypothetical protein